jgi:hypothetical protein
MQINAFQRHAMQQFCGGEFAHLTTESELQSCGDALFRYIMSELATDQDCVSTEDAVSRIRSAIASLLDVWKGLDAVVELPEAHSPQQMPYEAKWHNGSVFVSGPGLGGDVRCRDDKDAELVAEALNAIGTRTEPEPKVPTILLTDTTRFYYQFRLAEEEKAEVIDAGILWSFTGNLGEPFSSPDDALRAAVDHYAINLPEWESVAGAYGLDSSFQYSELQRFHYTEQYIKLHFISLMTLPVKLAVVRQMVESTNV